MFQISSHHITSKWCSGDKAAVTLVNGGKSICCAPPSPRKVFYLRLKQLSFMTLKDDIVNYNNKIITYIEKQNPNHKIV